MTRPHPATVPATEEDNDAYRASLCRDCHACPYLAGHTRCADCHELYRTDPRTEETPWPTSPTP